MRTKASIILTLCMLIGFNFSIYKKEQIKTQGDTVLLELAPVDPRSLMQGDYMALRYAIERSTPVDKLAPHQQRGYMVISTDENNVTEFVRFYDGGTLASGEKRLHFHRHYNQIRIVPNAFFFQEGHAEHYENAKYGVFKFDDSGNHLLVGLADEKFNTIKPEDTVNDGNE